MSGGTSSGKEGVRILRNGVKSLRRMQRMVVIDVMLNIHS